MVPPDAAHWDAQEQAYRTGATAWDGIHQQIVQDNAAFRNAADSTGFEKAHEAGAMLAEEAKTISEWHDGVATKCNGIAGVLRETAAAQDQLVRDADAKINAARLPGEREALVGTYHTQARTQTGWGVEAAMALHTSFKASTENTRALDLLTRYGDIAQSPSVQPVDNPSPGIEQDGDPRKRPTDEGNDKAPTAEPPTNSAGGASTQPGVDSGSKTATGSEGVSAAGGPLTQANPGTATRQAASPLGGGGMPSMGGGGSGMGSGGMPKMPGGLGSGGMGSNPLSSGMGQMPGAGSGLPGTGGVPGSGAGAGSPAAAFNQGLSTGGAIGGGMPSATPAAPPSPSPALTGGGHAVPAAPVSATGGGGMSPAAAQTGMVAPAAPAAAPTGAGMGAGGGAPMMLPPGSMGPPAGAVPPAATMAAGTALGAGGNAPSASPPPSGAGAGATLIPASVVAAGQTAAARERRESPDAAAAKELAWKLQHAAQAVGYPIEWAVGVFRSPSGSETVVTSNDGASYIPAGVFVPRSVRVLATDPLVDDLFRQLWFGWADPARVLIEYAQLRAAMGWRLAAAATTGPVTALRDAAVEHPPSCSRQTNPLLQPGQQVAAPFEMDAMHEHRLAVLWPDVYPRLMRVMDADAMLQDRIVAAASALLMNSATTQAVAVDGGIPGPVRQIWLTRGGDRDPSPQQWAEYDAAAKDFNTVTSIFRPGFVGQTDPSETIEELARYRAHWQVARTAELIAGWATRPLPLPDMCYAAAAVGNVHIRDLIVESLTSVEEDLGPA